MEVFHAAKSEDEQVEDSTNTDDLRLTADLSELEDTEQLFILNRNNERKQPLLYKK